MGRPRLLALLLAVIAIAAVGAVVALSNPLDEDAPASSVEGTPTTTVTPEPTASPSPTPTPTPTASPTPLPTPEPAAQYRTAIDARDAGDLERAAEGLEAIAEAGGELAPFARFRLAQVLQADGRHEEAVAAYATAELDPALPPALVTIARTEAARSLVELDRTDEAGALLIAIVDDPASTSADRASALWQHAEILQSDGDPQWSDSATAVIVASPGHPAASVALDALEEAELEPPALAAAYVRYLARQNGLATERYQAILDSDVAPDPTTAGIAWFYLGALAERVPDRNAAIDAYTESLAVDPFGSRADDAAYWRGRVAEEQQDFESAEQFYAVLVTDYPSSGFVADAALRGSLASLEAGNQAAALAQLAAIAEGGGSNAAAAARWYDLIAGPDTRIEAGVPAAREIDPRSFAAILEIAGPAALDPPLIEPLPQPASDFELVDTWLTSRFGPPRGSTPVAPASFTSTALMLVDAGERSLARAILLADLASFAGDEHAIIGASAEAATTGLNDVGLLGTMRVLRTLGTTERLETPAALEQLAYPAAWPELLTAASEEFEVPPLLMLALIRQESAFEPDVVSPAGAVGLTQVIPPTGVQIASWLDEEWGGPASLTDPQTSLRYGAAYLSAQLENFEGNMFAALAAYNAGPSNAQRWLDSQVGAGADGYVQAIDFEETRRYVTTVIEQYAWYRYVYGLTEEPSIR